MSRAFRARVGSCSAASAMAPDSSWSTHARARCVAGTRVRRAAQARSSASDSCPSPPMPSSVNTQGLSLRSVDDSAASTFTSPITAGARASRSSGSMPARRTADALDRVRPDAGSDAGEQRRDLFGRHDPGVGADASGNDDHRFRAWRRHGRRLRMAAGEASFRLLPGTRAAGQQRHRDFAPTTASSTSSHSVGMRSSCTRATTRRRPLRKVTAPGFMPDNIHWDGRG